MTMKKVMYEDEDALNRVNLNGKETFRVRGGVHQGQGSGNKGY